MNTALQTLRRLNLSHIRRHPLMHDSVSVIALYASLGLNVITLGLLVLRVHQVDYPVPTHYVSLVGFDHVGNWLETYRIALFGFLVTFLNGALAAKSFHRNRVVSFFLLLGAVVVSMLCLVIGHAFAVIV